MQSRGDIHMELCARISAAERRFSKGPGLDEGALRKMQQAAEMAFLAEKNRDLSSLRANAMATAVQAMLVVYSLDGALS